MSKSPTYVSIDIECDGPAPGLNSMLALGAAAFIEDEEVDHFYSTIKPLDGTWQNTETMAWWKTQPEAWEIVTSDTQPAGPTMQVFNAWCLELPKPRIAVAWPAAFDFAWINYYCHRFCGSNPLGFACLDIRSYANGLAGSTEYYGLKEIRQRVGDIDRTGLRPHVALDDAIEQGRLFVALRKYAREKHGS